LVSRVSAQVIFPEAQDWDISRFQRTDGGTTGTRSHNRCAVHEATTAVEVFAGSFFFFFF
jgi:hypothetical protein